MEALQGWDAQEESPTVVHLTMCLLALDEQYDRQASELRKCLRPAEEAKIFSKMLQVQLAKAYANTAAAESQETAMSKALKEAEDRHAHQLGEAYLLTRAKQRTLAAERQNPLIVEGILVHLPERRRTGVVVPPAPPPLEVSEVEPLIPLTQPLPREEADS